MEVLGYKCFNEDLTNRYGIKFDIGKKYSISGDIKYGLNGNGFHMCKNFEDTLRYFDAFNDLVSICLVKGSGDIVYTFDDYNEYYDLYCVRNLEILKLLSRKEIINMGLNLKGPRLERFLSSIKLTSNEIILFQTKFEKDSFILNVIEYYQQNNKSVFEKIYTKKQ